MDESVLHAVLQEGHDILFLRLGQFDASRVLQSRVYRHRHESLPNARLVDHDSTQVVEILVEEFEIADYRPVLCSKFELFEMDKGEFPVNLVHHSYRGVVLFLSQVHSGNVELRILFHGLIGRKQSHRDRHDQHL